MLDYTLLPAGAMRFISTESLGHSEYNRASSTFEPFVCLVALRPKSTAMVMAGQSVHLTTLFSWASLNKQLTSTSSTYFRW